MGLCQLFRDFLSPGSVMANLRFLCTTCMTEVIMKKTRDSSFFPPTPLLAVATTSNTKTLEPSDCMEREVEYLKLVFSRESVCSPSSEW